MFGNRQSRDDARIAELERRVREVEHGLTAARTDYAELAAKAYRYLKGAERAASRAEAAQAEADAERARAPEDDPQQTLDVDTPLRLHRNTALGRARTPRAAQEG